MTKRNTKADRVNLPGGCSISPLKVVPQNWQKVTKLSRDWYFYYRFYDPIHAPKGQLIIAKGMNHLKTAAQRREMTQDLMNHELDQLQAGVNPITNAQTLPTLSGDLDENTPLNFAIRMAYETISCDPKTMEDIKSMMNYVPLAITLLKFDNIPVGEVRKKHVRRILDKCKDIKFRIDPGTGKRIDVTWSDHKFNKYRSYLMSLFAELVELEAIEQNPCRDIRKKKVIKTIRDTLTKEQCLQVDTHLFKTDRDFWRFTHIFFHSGARISELFKIKGKDVNLVNQTFKRLVKKGRSYMEKLTTIKDIALPLWAELLAQCGPNDFVFSAGLVPGPAAIRADQINKRWKRHVKDKLGITADFYSLKHLNTTQTVDLLDNAAAAAQNAHTSTAMVDNIYDVNRPQRMHDRLKKVNNPFVTAVAPTGLTGNCAPLVIPGPLAGDPFARTRCAPCVSPYIAPTRQRFPLRAA